MLFSAREYLASHWLDLAEGRPKNMPDGLQNRYPARG
jgi:hypothetical protein